MRKLFSILFILIVFSLAVSLVSGENKKIDVNVVVSNESLNNSGNISINSSNPLQAEVIGGKEISVKQNEINSSFSNSFNELFFYKSDNSWFVPFILLGIILLLILIYELRGKHVRKISKKKAVKFR